MSFDLRTHIRDKNGHIINVNPYRLTIVNGQRLFERPVDSGLKYYENGEPTPETIELLKKQTESKVEEVVKVVEKANEQLKPTLVKPGVTK